MTKTFDDPISNDNRSYDYRGFTFGARDEYRIIERWITAGSKVIDLGCGNGSLMKYILQRKNVDIDGIDIAESGVKYALDQGLTARIGKIDDASTYNVYADFEYDYAICNVTLMMVLYPEVLLAEMKRIARHHIISFNNFAHFSNRLDLLLRGRMPRPMLFGYDWYSTGHIHQLSIRDFEEFCMANNLKIIRRHHLGDIGTLARLAPNFFAVTSIFLTTDERW